MSQVGKERELIQDLRDKCNLRRANNNEEDFADINSSGTPESGRDSRGSAFSTCSDSDEPSSGSSGRSSINQEESIELTLSKPVRSNLIPEDDRVIKIVEQVRTKFMDSCDTEASKACYDPIDFAEVAKPLITEPNQREQSVAFRWISRFFNFQQILAEPSSGLLEKDIDSAVESLKELLKFRNELQLSRAKAEDFAQEFYILSGIFAHGQDKQGIPVLYLRARVHRRWSSKLDNSFRRYVAWQIDQMTKSRPGMPISKTAGKSSSVKDGSFGICFDCLNVSYACLDMDFLKFLVRMLVQYYPTYCRYALCTDLPWLFRSVWKLVRSWLPEEAQSSVQLITSKQLVDYIDPDQIPNSQKIDDLKANQKPTKCKHQLPANLSSIGTLAERAQELDLSSSELKQIKVHVDKVRKEYENLGAL